MSPGFVVREVRASDAVALLALQHALDSESPMMMVEPSERDSTADRLVEHIAGVMASDNSTILVAAEDDELIGYVEAEGGPYRRNHHSAYVVIGVRRAWQGRGVGRALLGSLTDWAAANHLRRLELTVRVDNPRARRQYEHLGYVLEGTRRGSLIVAGHLVDELAMALVLPSETGASPPGSS